MDVVRKNPNVVLIIIIEYSQEKYFLDNNFLLSLINSNINFGLRACFNLQIMNASAIGVMSCRHVLYHTFHEHFDMEFLEYVLFSWYT